MTITIRTLIASAIIAASFSVAQAQTTTDLVEPNTMISPKPSTETKGPSLDGLKAAPATTDAKEKSQDVPKPQADIVLQPAVPPAVIPPPAPAAASVSVPPKPAQTATNPDTDVILRSIGTLSKSIEDVQRNQLDTGIQLGMLNKRIEALEQKSSPASPPPAKTDDVVSKVQPTKDAVAPKSEQASAEPPAIRFTGNPQENLPEGWLVNRSKDRM